MEQLNEKNLRQGTLKYLVDPIVEIDMYSPKIQQDSIVVVMRVEGSYDAGYDMSSFIEKLPFGVLDTEVQEIPNTEGYYEIFIEMERDDEFPENLMRILHDAGSLCAEETQSTFGKAFCMHRITRSQWTLTRRFCVPMFAYIQKSKTFASSSSTA